MKKVLVSIMLVAMLMITGCEKVVESKYVEGTYFGYQGYTSYGKNYVVSAVVYVDAKGFIKSVFIDSTYFSNNVYTSKKVLGDAYNMKPSSAIGKEWYEQMAVLEDRIVKEQGVAWLTYDEEGTIPTDVISGVTIDVADYHKAVISALQQAIKD